MPQYIDVLVYGQLLGNASLGQQLFISYGPKCDAEFLAHYGFRPSGNTHVKCKGGALTSTAAGERERAGVSAASSQTSKVCVCVRVCVVCVLIC